MLRVRKELLPLVKVFASYDIMFHNSAAREVWEFEKKHPLTPEIICRMTKLIEPKHYLADTISLKKAYQLACCV